MVTDIARNQIKSYRQLPVNFYQIQTKFRDEIRPRFGVMRGREFIMKDAYSFDKDVDGLRESYRKMYEAYVRIFTRLGLDFRAVAADNGSIGGSGSHEFHVIADTGEDAIAYCPTSDFAANVEAAEALPLTAQRAAPAEEMKKTATPGKAKCEAVAELLNIPLERTIKSIILATENEGAEPTIWLLMLRGDHDLNEIKASKLPGLADFRMATEAEIIETFGTPPGYLGPINTKKPVKVDRGPHGREHERLRGRLERGGFPHHRRELGPRSAGAGGGRHPQCQEGRSFAGRQGRDRHLPRH